MQSRKGEPERPILRGIAMSALTVSVFALAATAANAEEVMLPGITVYSTTPQLPAKAKTKPKAVSAPTISTEAEATPAGNTIGEVRPHHATVSVEDPASPTRPPSTGDAGEFLRHVNGVSAGRQGGHGLEPSIRGLDQNQLGITNDGAYQFGGCPNRMDPPTSHMQLYTFDKVTVSKGFQSVLSGAPAPGGSIAFERVNPQFDEGSGVDSHVKAGIGYNSNGEAFESFFDTSMGNAWGYIRAFGSYATQNNYEDGGGSEIRSAFDQIGGGLMLGRTWDSNSWITLKVENNNVDDALFPGSGMDAPVTDDWAYQIRGETDLDWGLIRGVKADVYVTTVDHTMNNFELRALTAPMMMEARTESDTYGGKLVFNGVAGATTFDIGMDYREVDRDGTRFAGPTLAMTQSFIWPDTSIKEASIFGEATTVVSPTTRVTAGLRYAHVDASAGEKASQDPTAMGNQRPTNLYLIANGVSETDAAEDNVSGLLRVEEELGGGFTLFATLSRAVRTADSTERYMASFSGLGGTSSWVGNPALEPEKHHQVDIGITWNGKDAEFKGSIFFNDVTDFIQLYSGQTVGPWTNASVFRNIDATLTGVEAETALRLADFLRLNLAAAYTYGENETDNTPLGQIAPLTGRMELLYDDTKVIAGVRVNAASKQSRVDTASSEQDFGKTDGWVTIDLFGAYNFTKNFQVSGGITNLFDEEYAYHLNQRDAEGLSYQVNEPGRSYYVRAVTQF